MRGTMMDFPLVLPVVLERAGKLFGDIEIIWHRPDKTAVRSTYRDFVERARRVSNALLKLGLRRGDRVATMLWNHCTHLEAFFGVPCAGGILHALNLRLHPHEIAKIANHAEDRFLIVDDVLLPLYEKFRADVRFEAVIVVPYGSSHVPEGFLNFEEFLEQGKGQFRYPDIDENDGASMCFTSGTTGFSQGVIYTHRSLVLHSMAEAMVDAFALSHHDTIMPLAPMFHANAWGVPYTAVMTGTKMVMVGPVVEAEFVLDTLLKERVTVANAVPTVWINVLEALEKYPGRWKFEKPVRVVSGGTAPPVELMRRLDRHGIRILHLWGMTETSPLATTGHLKSRMKGWSEEQQYQIRAKQGWPVPLIDLRVMRPEGEAQWDGVTPGEIEIRGPWVAGQYYKAPDQAHKWTEDGWFRTGDVGTIDADGIMKIVDRAKDLVKSGGEWISSVDLENALMGHPAVKEACVVGIPHPKWQERPLAAVVLRDGIKVSGDDLREFLARDFAKWQLPDAFVFVEAIPRTSVGKFKKTAVREQFANWNWD
ncbi:MAG TPA: long-chain fatty acid--CoA ligase [Candidatus Limnocylindrales bacterium]|nr:long-chain fatty acid--CoA ligase [Candidatus Limnocylindrales bacterium]